jgi:hypothetical protein
MSDDGSRPGTTAEAPPAGPTPHRAASCRMNTLCYKESSESRRVSHSCSLQASPVDAGGDFVEESDAAIILRNGGGRNVQPPVQPAVL